MNQFLTLVLLFCMLILGGCGWVSPQLADVKRIAISRSKEGLDGFVVVKDDARLHPKTGEMARLTSRVRKPVIQLLNNKNELINQIELPRGKVDFFYQENIAASGKSYFFVAVNELFDSERADSRAAYENGMFWIHSSRLEPMMETEDGKTRLPLLITGATKGGTDGTILEVICGDSRPGAPVTYNRYVFENDVWLKKSKSRVVNCPAYYTNDVSVFPPESDFPQ